MAETCIVCLGDLDGTSADVPPLGETVADEPPGASDDRPAKNTRKLRNKSTKASAEEEGWIAHLLPCGHNLHNECLKPWVERANSCPICRTSFNMVELSAVIGGPVLSSYAVQDKQQVADIDPSMIVDDDALNLDPCIVCEEYGDTTELLLCDGCNSSCHVYCAGLDEIPLGLWYCHDCAGPSSQAHPYGTGRLSRQSRPRRLGHTTARDSIAWARVWRTVFDRLGMDLDFPFDEDTPEHGRTEAHDREFNEWERRLQVAARQGAESRFRQTAPVLLHPPASRPRHPAPPAESQEEIRAWNAFEKAREQVAAMENRITPTRRKRKSPTSSPSEPEPERETGRPLKRPRAWRAHNAGESSRSVAAGESSGAVGALDGYNGRTMPATRPRAAAAAPSFLQSLLKEVETVSAPTTEAPQAGIPGLIPMVEGASSPQSSSPADSPSPTGSNHPTPRALTPPPISLGRPLSPPPLTSSVVPVYPSVPNFAPFSPADGEADTERHLRQQRVSHRPPNTSPPRSKDVSPLRSAMSYSTKAEIQKMVRAALKPRYEAKEVNKDQFADINRDVSRLLYDKVGDANAMADGKARQKWQQIAHEEVEKAVKALKPETQVEPTITTGTASASTVEPTAAS